MTPIKFVCCECGAEVTTWGETERYPPLCSLCIFRPGWNVTKADYFERWGDDPPLSLPEGDDE